MIAVRRALLRILAVVGAWYLVISIVPVTQWWARALSNPWLDPDGDVLVVPGSDVLSPGIIGESSYWRAVYALRAWRNGHFNTVVLAGADTAPAMRDFLVAEGVPAGAIRVEDRSLSTHENAMFTRDLLNQLPGKKTLLTSDYHLYRAQRAFRKQGIDVSPCPFPDVLKRGNKWTNRAPLFFELTVETVKIAWYKFQGWI